MPLSQAGIHRALNGFRGVAPSANTYIGLNSAYSAVGGNEVSTAGGTYARKLATWGTPGSGAMLLSALSAFNLPSGALVGFVSIWDDATSTAAANFLGMFAAGGSPFEYSLIGTDSYVYAPNHGLSNDQAITPLGSTAGGGNLAVGTVYFVTAAETHRFRVATSSGGVGVVTFSDFTQFQSSNAYFTRVNTDSYTSGGTFAVSNFSLDGSF